jgi:Tol biopolymer transport system component
MHRLISNNVNLKDLIILNKLSIKNRFKQMNDKKIRRFNESEENLNSKLSKDSSYHLVWYPVKGDVKPQENGQYLVTIKKRDFSDEKVVTIGSYNFSPFSKKFEWSHGARTIAFAELPNPY